jgi:hypothetical protein
MTATIRSLPRPLRLAMLATLPMVAGLPGSGAPRPVTAGLHTGIACPLDSPGHTESATRADLDLAAADLVARAQPKQVGERS